MTARIHLCGRVTVELDSRRVERDLPGRQGRLLFVYLAATRARSSTRAELVTGERTARALVHVDPYRETGHRLLMEILAADGNRAQALLVYDELRRRLHDDLATAPSAATQSVYRALL